MKNKYQKYQHQAKVLLAKGKLFAGRKLRAYLLWEHSWKTTSAGIVVVFVAGFMAFNILHATALTTTLKPDGDASTGWTVTGGTNDATCTGGTHCDYVDEGASWVDGDYVSTGSSGSGNEREAYTLSTQTGIASASQVVVNVRLKYGTLGSTPDTVNFGLTVNGVDQTSTPVTVPSTFTNYTATFNGSWTQADVDSMQIYMIRTVVGSSGPASSRDDDVQVSNVYATLTYTPNLTVSQSAYRWYANQDVSTTSTFVKAWGGSAEDNPLGVASTSDGGYVVTGSTLSYTVGNYDAYLAKYDSSGTLSWSRTWGGTGSDFAKSVIQTSDGGFAIAGDTSSYTAGITDAFLAKYDSSGTLSWSRTWGGTGGDNGNEVAQTSDGGYALAGNTSSYGSGSTDAFLAKYDSSGTLSWSRTWGGTGVDDGNGLTLTSDGGFAIAGDTTSYTAGSSDAFLAKYDSSGTLSWSRTWGGTGTDVARKLVQTSDGGYALAGNTSSYGTATDTALIKYNSSGTFVWNAIKDTDSGFDNGNDVVQSSDGSLVVVGSGYRSASGGSDAIIAKYSPSGTITGCSSPMCQNPSAGTSSPTASTTSPSAGTSSPTASTTSPSVTILSPTASDTVIVAFNAAPSIDVGSPLGGVSQDTAATAPAEGTPFRLRLDLHMSGSTVNTNTVQYKLKFAPKGVAASCDLVATGSYTDVTDTSTIQYYDNTNGSNGLSLTQGASFPANYPAHNTDTLVPENYLEKGTTVFTNPSSIPVNQDGVWDFALVAYHSLQNDRYCFKVFNSNDTVINTYSQIPELIIPPATFGQAAYRWYNPEPSGSNQTFAQAYGDSAADSNEDVAPTSDGGYVTTGAIGDNISLTKYNSSGTIVWSRQLYSQTGGGIGSAVIQTSGGYAIAGSVTSDADASTDAVLILCNTDGTVITSTEWGTSNEEYANDVIETSNGSFAVVGNMYNSTGVSDAFIFTTDDGGGLLWNRTWGISTYNDFAEGVAQKASDGSLLVTGSTASYGGAGSIDVYISDFDLTTGASNWSRTWGGTNIEYGQSITTTSDGGFAVSGYTNSFRDAFKNDLILIKYDSTNNFSWSKTWEGGSVDNTTIVQTSDGGYAISGDTNAYGGYGKNIFLIKFDSSGTTGWQHTWGSGTTSGDEFGGGLIQTADGGYVIAGTTNGYGVGGNDALLLKYDSSGNIAGCVSPMCQTPNFATSEPAQLISSPTIPTVNPSGYSFYPTIYSDIVTPTTTVIIASSAAVGNPLAPQNSPLDLSSLTPLNLRVAIAIDNSGVAANDLALKLQYAPRAGAASCSAVPVGNYSDVTQNTVIAYYDSSSYINGAGIVDSPNDPSDGSRTMVTQSYQENNNFTNGASPIYAGQDGIWQFSLVINNSTLKGNDFCLRAYSVTDSNMLTAANVADVAYAPQMIQLMRNGKWFNRQGILQPFSL